MQRAAWETLSEMRPLTRWDVIFVVIVAAGAGTRFLTLAPKPSGWLLVLDVIVSASLGLLVAVVIASLVRRAWLDRLGFTLGVVVVVLGGLTVLVLVDFVAGLTMGLVRPGGG